MGLEIQQFGSNRGGSAMIGLKASQKMLFFRSDDMLSWHFFVNHSIYGLYIYIYICYLTMILPMVIDDDP